MYACTAFVANKLLHKYTLYTNAGIMITIFPTCNSNSLLE